MVNKGGGKCIKRAKPYYTKKVGSGSKENVPDSVIKKLFQINFLSNTRDKSDSMELCMKKKVHTNYINNKKGKNIALALYPKKEVTCVKSSKEKSRSTSSLFVWACIHFPANRPICRACALRILTLESSSTSSLFVWACIHFPANQGCGYGSGLDPYSIGSVDPDPDLGGQK
jgi:hypothetical protein